MRTVLTTGVLTIAGVLVGVLLTAKSQTAGENRDKRRTLYLEILEFLDGMPLATNAASLAGDFDGFHERLWGRLRTLTTQLDLFASPRVVVAWNGLRESLSTDELDKATHERIARGEDPQIAVIEAHTVFIASQRMVLLNAMHRDLGLRSRLATSTTKGSLLRRLLTR
jgi:hypothetical protein